MFTITLEQTARDVANRLSEPTLKRLEKAQDRLSDMNVIANAVEAIKDQGEITISTNSSLKNR